MFKTFTAEQSEMLIDWGENAGSAPSGGSRCTAHWNAAWLWPSYSSFPFATKTIIMGKWKRPKKGEREVQDSPPWWCLPHSQLSTVESSLWFALQPNRPNNITTTAATIITITDEHHRCQQVSLSFAVHKFSHWWSKLINFLLLGMFPLPQMEKWKLKVPTPKADFIRHFIGCSIRSSALDETENNQIIQTPCGKHLLTQL